MYKTFKKCKYKFLISILTFSFFFAMGVNFSLSAETLQKDYPDTKSKSDSIESEKNTPQIGVPAETSGMKAFKDPKTGEFTTPNSNDALSAQTLQLNTSSEGLVETQAPNGGIMINLQGRFRSFMSATKNANGQTSISCSQAHVQTAPRDVR